MLNKNDKICTRIFRLKNTRRAYICVLLCGNAIACRFRARVAYKSNIWEIDEFSCALPYRYLSPLLYGLMFHFVCTNEAQALILTAPLPKILKLERIGLKLGRRVKKKAPSIELAVEVPMSAHNRAIMNPLVKLIESSSRL